MRGSIGMVVVACVAATLGYTVSEWRKTSMTKTDVVQAAPTRKPSSIPYPAPDSLRISDASKWYTASVEQIDRNLSGADVSERLSNAWQVKSRLRHAAALSLYDQELAGEFFAKHPLPKIEELLGSPIEAAAEPKKAEALRVLTTVTEVERRAFPGTIGEAIGMELWDGHRHWVMTKDGWRPKGSL